MKFPRKFDVGMVSSKEEHNGILLKDLQEQPTYSKVLVKAKVMNVEAVTKLAGGLRKQGSNYS